MQEPSRQGLARSTPPPAIVLFADLKRWRLARRERRARLESSRSSQPGMDREAARTPAELSRDVGTDWEESIRRIVQFDARLLHVERVNFWTLSQQTSTIHCDAGYVASVRTFEHGATLFESDLPE
jgi:hypothetical protein